MESIGYCGCGCGTRTNLDRRGNPRAFLRGHARRAVTLPDGRRVCKKCGEAKSLDEFTKRTSSRFVDGRDPWCKKCYAEKSREYYAKSKESYQRTSYRRSIKRKYGITWDQYEALLEEQGGVCKICQEDNRLVVDHDHRTSEIRGIICHRCNVGLASFQDRKDLLMNAINYLDPDGFKNLAFELALGAAEL